MSGPVTVSPAPVASRLAPARRGRTRRRDRGALPTVSLRRRVILMSSGVLLVVLLATGVATDALFSALSRAELNARVAERAATAQQLAVRRVPPRQIARRLNGGPIRAELIAADGTDYGGVEPPGPGVRSVHRVLADGARLSLSMDLDTVTAPQQRLRRILVEVGLAGLAAAVLALLVTTRAALAPLDAITALARSISHGQRGRRLTPARVDTELGRTALAFDGMLDALEGVESHARAEQRRAEVAEMNALAAAERMRRFLDDAAHELRTPICGILAAAEASASPRLDAEQRERLQLLLISEAHRGQRLVEDLLTLARLDAGAPAQRAPVDLYELVEQETRRVGLLAPDLRFTRLGGPATVTGDGAQLARLVVNLLDNARAHTPDGGTIVIRTERDPSAGQATLSVTDAGCGVPAEDRERIFDRLTRLDTARTRPGGSGLGLAIARAIAHAHAGTLRCTEPPAGTTGACFLLTLPITRSLADEQPARRPA